MVTYKLFATVVNDETMAKAAQERFSRITPQYILIYRKTKPRTMQCVEIKGKDTERLTSRDRLWLRDCIMALMTEAAAKSKEQSKKRLAELVDALEQALREEQEKLEKETDEHGEGESDN